MTKTTNITAAVVTGALVLFAAGAPASAAPATATVATKVADASDVQSPAMTEAEDDSASCSRSRKRLWVEGEGWLVRRVTICR